MRSNNQNGSERKRRLNLGGSRGSLQGLGARDVARDGGEAKFHGDGRVFVFPRTHLPLFDIGRCVCVCACVTEHVYGQDLEGRLDSRREEGKDGRWGGCLTWEMEAVMEGVEGRPWWIRPRAAREPTRARTERVTKVRLISIFA